ncbi:hypothetical protein LZ30DRAFT_277606 [Colletotrichum cereale]|nr:hypothetical protein LZ30DRAFT_277606 [Colletotrichum cereale]
MDHVNGTMRGPRQSWCSTELRVTLGWVSRRFSSSHRRTLTNKQPTHVSARFVMTPTAEKMLSRGPYTSKPHQEGQTDPPRSDKPTRVYPYHASSFPTITRPASIVPFTGDKGESNPTRALCKISVRDCRR